MIASSEGPIIRSVSALPNNNVSFAATRGIYVGVGGDINVQFAIRVSPDGDAANAVNVTQVFTNFPTGQILPVRVNKIFEANTTANGLVLVY